jgi:protein-tyrosine phosphatase
METSHKQQMERQYPHLRGRVFRLLETQKADIPDPYKQPRAAFEAALSQIETGVQDWQRKFAALAGTKVK